MSETQETSSGLGLKIGAVVAVLLVGVVYFAYSGSKTPSQPETAAPQVDLPESRPKNPIQAKPMQDRPADLDQADDAHQEIKPRAGIDVTPMQRPAAPAGVPGRSRPEGSERAGRDAAPDAADADEADPEDLPTLKQMALSDPDPERRLTAVTLLGVSENKGAIPILAAALSDQDEDVRMEAVLALADFADEAPVDALEIALSDPSADVRYEALDVLSDIETPEAYQAMKKALTDPDEDVRELAQLLSELYADEDYAQ